MDREDLKVAKQILFKRTHRAMRKHQATREKARARRNARRLCEDRAGEGVALEAVEKGWIA